MSQQVVQPPPAVGPPGQAGAPAAVRFGWRRALLLGGVILVIAGCGVAMLLLLGSDFGPGPVIIGVCVAVLPVPVFVAAYLWLDRYEPEPWRYLAYAFGWGSCVATLGALGLNTAISRWLASQGLSQSFAAVFGAPLVEETLKALGPVLLYLFLRRKAINSITDGLVYCGLSATGFAMMENILYLGRVYVSGSEQLGLPSQGAIMVVALFLIRLGLMGFAHPLFTSMTGLGLGFSARTSNSAARWFAPICGWLVAMMLHGSWNLMATIAPSNLVYEVFGYFGVALPLLVTVVAVALYIRAGEGRLVGRVLTGYARAGWFSPPEVAALSTVSRRIMAGYWARRYAGKQGAAAMRGYQTAATRLAMLRDAAEHGRGAGDFVTDERALLEAVVRYREVFTGSDRRVPGALWNGRAYRLDFPDGSTRTLAAPATPVVPVPVDARPVAGSPPPPIAPPPYYRPATGWAPPGR